MRPFFPRADGESRPPAVWREALSWYRVGAHRSLSGTHTLLNSGEIVFYDIHFSS